MPKPQPKQKHDPDSWLRKLKTPKAIEKWMATEKDYITEYILPAAIAAANNPKATTDQVKNLGELVELIPDDVMRNVYYTTVGDAWPVFKKNYKLQKREEPKKKEKKKTVIKDDEWTFTIINDKNDIEYVTDKLTEDQKKSIHQYQFVEWNKAYYFIDTIEHASMYIKLRQKSNFALRILYHIKRSKNKNKRVVAIYNTSGKSEIIDIETKQLTSLQAFKEFTEGAGYFLFKGDNNDLMRIKTKLMEEEKPCVQLDTLGWHKKGFFAFSNGIIRDGQFVPVDEFGIVGFDDHNFFIPYHPGTEETSNMNEKRFSWKPGESTWKEWSELYYQVFGLAGMVTMVFGAATVFSDHIFYIKTNFPILFFYGEGGSGKSKMIQFIQYWFGEPQPSLKVSEKANTDKGKIRKMAQFSNAIALFEEFVNSIDMAAIKTFTGFYDRYGYERADIDSKYGTETVPVQSTVAFTGNEYPSDDPLLQRMILIDHNVNEFSEEQQKRFDELNKMNRKGLTQMIMHLLSARAYLEQHWETHYEKQLAEFKSMCSDIKVPSRMVENNAVLIATYTCLKAAGITFPFSLSDLTAFLKATMKAQAEKRDTGGVLQRFWDIVVHLLMTKQIEVGKQIELDGNELLLRVSEVHGYYSQIHYHMYRQAALNKNTLMQKLRDSSAFIDTMKSARFSDKNTSCFVFEVTKINVDLSYYIHGYRTGEKPESASTGAGKQVNMPLKDFTEPKKEDRPPDFDDEPDWVKGR